MIGDDLSYLKSSVTGFRSMLITGLVLSYYIIKAVLIESLSIRTSKLS